MSNQTFLIVIILGVALMAGFVYFRNKALSVGKLAASLSKSLEASEKKVAQLEEEKTLKNYSLR